MTNNKLVELGEAFEKCHFYEFAQERDNYLRVALWAARWMAKKDASIAKSIGDDAYKIALQATILKSQNTQKGIAIAGEMIEKAITKNAEENLR